VFGASLSTAAISGDADKDAAKCQQAVGKAYEKLAAKKFKEFVKCKKAALKGGAIAASALEDCVADAGTVGSITADSKGKIAKAVAKLGDAIGKKCGGVNTGLAFPGICASLTGDALRDCIDQRVECRVCLTLNAIDNLAVDCDAFDDGMTNLSCPYETFNLRSPASLHLIQLHLIPISLSLICNICRILPDLGPLTISSGSISLCILIILTQLGVILFISTNKFTNSSSENEQYDPF
jgi:hypothetical protein